MDSASGFVSDFDTPIVYQITVQGKIPSDWSNRLEGMAIRHSILDDGAPITILIGELSDQAALSGVLNSIYELQLPLIAVIKLTQTNTRYKHAQPEDEEPVNGPEV